MSYGRNSQNRGRQAELRVARIARDMGFNTEMSAYLDHVRKTDVALWVEALRLGMIDLQVSCTPKSAETMRKLERLGVHAVVAGQHIPDEEVSNQICEAFSDWWNNYYQEA